MEDKIKELYPSNRVRVGKDQTKPGRKEEREGFIQ